MDDKGQTTKKAKGNTLHSFEFFKLDAKAGNTGTKENLFMYLLWIFFRGVN